MNAFPRLPFEALPPPLRDTFATVVKRVGYYGEFFAILAHVPAALAQFMDYTKAVKAPLSDRQNELLALAVCTRVGADYERIQHERLSLTLGLPRAWIAALTNRTPRDSVAFDADEQALLALADALGARRSARCAVELEAVRALLGEAAAVAAVLQVARFEMLGTVLAAFEMRLPVESPLDD